MDKIYLVTEGEYSSYGVIAAFSTEEKANKLIEFLNKERGSYAGVEEYELDLEFGNYDIWHVGMKKDGSLIERPYKTETMFPCPTVYDIIEASHFDKKTKMEKIDYNYLSYNAICKSEKQAIKAANEIRTQLIALDKWGIDE